MSSVNWGKIYADFIFQLESARAILKDTDIPYESIAFEDSLKLQLNPIFNRAIIEFDDKNGVKDNYIGKREKELIYKITDIIIENSDYSKKLYESIQIEIDEDGNPNISVENEAILEYFLISNDYEDEIAAKYIHNKRMKTKSSVISICITLENLCCQLLKEFLLKKHEGDLFDNKTITFKDMKRFENIGDTKQYLVDSELESIFRGNFKSWSSKIFNYCKKVDKEINVFLEKREEIFDEIEELYQRRNLLVHSNGVVNHIYLNLVSPKYKEKFDNGDDIEIDIDIDYINNKIKIVEEFGTIIFYLFYKILEDRESDVDLNSILLKYLKRENEAIPIIYKDMQSRAKESENKLIYKVNYFLYFRVNNLYDRIENEIKNFDTSVYTNEYKLAKKIIMQDIDCEKDAIDYYENLDDVSFVNVYKWPLMRLLSENERYIRYCKNRINKIFGISDKESEINEVIIEKIENL